MRTSLLRCLACVGLMLSFQMACVDTPKTDTGSAPLYVFDGASHSVLAWDDISTIYDAGSASAANRTITSGKLASLSLGWAGMALDQSHGYLYLVSSGGTVVRVERIREQSGSVESSEVISFDLDDVDTDAYQGEFGQAAVNPVGSVLYVTQCKSDTGKSQIWAIPIGLMADGETITKDSGGGVIIGNTTIDGGTSDKHCTGVASSSDAVYGYYDTGNAINPGGTDYTGSRLRKGTTGGVFPATSSVIVGETGNTVTRLGQYGCLAYDTSNDYLYFARHGIDSGVTEQPLLAFTPGRFSPGLESGPDRTFTGPSDLRVIAHAGQKDWLVGARSGATNTLWIWKGPSSGDASVPVSLPDTGSGSVQIYGLALDGSR